MTNRAGQIEAFSPGLVRAEPIGSLLQARTIALADAAIWPLWRAVHIERGTIQIASPGSDSSFEGPCFAWLPWTRDSRLRILAGTIGAHVAISNTLLSNAIGHKAESADLHAVAEHQSCITLAENSNTARTIARCFEGILREVDEAGASSATVIEALMRIVLIELWRAQGAPGSYDTAANPSQRLMNQFNSLLEMQFREHWTVADYATSIGISADRLNDICRRNRSKTPKQLIKARIGNEARLLLENSTHSGEQIAGLLGFPSAAQFNRFFKNVYGKPPGIYRQQARSRVRVGPPDSQSNMYEWP